MFIANPSHKPAAPARPTLTPAWRALLGEDTPKEGAAGDDPWACSSFHASSWDLRHGLDIEEHEWIDAEIPPHLEGALQFA